MLMRLLLGYVYYNCTGIHNLKICPCLYGFSIKAFVIGYKKIGL